jgi:hypothetical protein
VNPVRTRQLGDGASYGQGSTLTNCLVFGPAHLTYDHLIRWIFADPAKVTALEEEMTEAIGAAKGGRNKIRL